MLYIDKAGPYVSACEGKALKSFDNLYHTLDKNKLEGHVEDLKSFVMSILSLDNVSVSVCHMHLKNDSLVYF